jgi:hypothetical protein
MPYKDTAQRREKDLVYRARYRAKHRDTLRVRDREAKRRRTPEQREAHNARRRASHAADPSSARERNKAWRSQHTEWFRARALQDSARLAAKRAEADLPGEEWRAIPGMDARYEVSNQGRMRRSCRGGSTWAGRILRVKPNKRGYVDATLFRKTLKLHRLIAASFLGMPLVPTNIVNHRDSARANNVLSNLQWTTSSGNARHAFAAGRRHGPTGGRNGRSKLTEDDVRAIRAARGAVTSAVLAQHYPISRASVYEIWERRTWKHVG